MSVSLLQSQHLSRVPGIVHGFSTREGGVSQGPFTSLNVGARVGDIRSAIDTNRDRILGALGRADATWISIHQMHGSNIVEVTRQAGRTIEADGLSTRDRAVVLAILVADCVPILVAPVSGNWVAALHAGWRGTVARIAELLVKRAGGLDVKPADLRVALGPAIGPCCFQIGEDVAAQITAGIPELPAGIIRGEGGRITADLWALNRAVLVAAGVPDTCIDSFRICTSCTPSFFSHRRDKGETGRQAGVIGLAAR